jgi:hypothetical protein
MWISPHGRKRNGAREADCFFCGSLSHLPSKFDAFATIFCAPSTAPAHFDISSTTLSVTTSKKPGRLSYSFRLFAIPGGLLPARRSRRERVQRIESAGRRSK